jgi:hypothetical protein
MLRELSWPLLGDGMVLGKEAVEAGDYVSGVLAESCAPSNSTINTLRNVVSAVFVSVPACVCVRAS